MKLLTVILPKGFMNVGITKSGKLLANTNDSANWDTLEFRIIRYLSDYFIFSNIKNTILPF